MNRRPYAVATTAVAMLIAAGMTAPAAFAHDDKPAPAADASDTAVKDTPPVAPDAARILGTPDVEKPAAPDTAATPTETPTAAAVPDLTATGLEAIHELVKKLEARLADLERRYAEKDGQPADTGQAPDAETPTVEAETPAADAKPAPPAPPAAAAAVAVAGEVVFPKTGKPSDPGNKRVISPRPSPLVKAATLKGPKIVVKKGDNITAVFAKPLAAGTVVTLPRDTVFDKRITITGDGTKDQPVLVTAAAGTGALPTFTTTQPGEYKDAGVVATRGTNVQLDQLAVKGTPSIGFSLGAKDGVANRIETDGAVNGAWIVSGEHGGTGDGTRVWNSLFTNGVMMPDTPGAEDDYGANGVSVQANNVTLSGITGRNLWSMDTPDYAKYGGDGSLAEIWERGDGLLLEYSSVKTSPRVLEGGGLKAGTATARVEHVYADGIKDSPFHFQEGGGPYGALKITMTQKDNNISGK